MNVAVAPCRVHSWRVSLGKRLREAREKAGLTQLEAAIQTKIQPAAISRMEHDRKTPKSDDLARLAQVYRCDPGWLLTGNLAEAEIAEPHMYPAFDEWLRSGAGKFSPEVVSMLRERRFKYTPTVDNYEMAAGYIRDAIEGATDRATEIVDQFNEQLAKSVAARGGRKIEISND